MNWEAVGAIAELAGALGVIVSLVYLASQIRQNTKSLQSNAFQAVSDSAIQRFLALAQDDDLADLYLTGISDWKSLSARERLQFDMWMRASLRGFENYYYQHKNGLLEEQLWAAHLEALRANVAPKGFAEWWLRARVTFSADFVDTVDRIIAEQSPAV